MKKRQPNHIICFILTLLLLSMNIQVFAGTVVHITKVSLNKTSDILLVGGTDTLKATIAPTKVTNKAIKWTSSNVSIAKVDGTGKVTALKVGTASITGVTVDRGLKVYCKVTVNPIIHVTKVSLNKATDILIAGATDNLKATISPVNATNKTIKWASSNINVAKVDSNGKITALANGHANITATSIDGGKINQCTITVNNPILHVTGVSLNKTTDTLIVGNTNHLTSTISPSNATNKDVKWTSSDDTIATVDNLGKVIAVSTGNVTITATTVDGSKTANCIITVNNPVTKVTSVSLDKTTDILLVGSTDNLLATVNPSNAVNKDVTWKSSDSSIATVDNVGKVTAIRAGTATITVTTVDGSKVGNCTVTVSNLITMVTKDVTLTNETIVGDLYVDKNVVLTIEGNLTVTGNLYVYGCVKNYGYLRVNNTMHLSLLTWDDTVENGKVCMLSNQNIYMGTDIGEMDFDIN
ncbi:MAG TPA: Ig-like domain-containing protein [Candidatus Paceibacterota bacterium]